MAIERFEDLKSWQEARMLARVVYRLTRREAFQGDRELVWQVRDAAASGMGNIAEAHGRYSFENKRRFLDIALGSTKELQSHFYIALDQEYVSNSEFDEVYRQADTACSLIRGSLNNLERQIAKRRAPKPGPRRHG